MNKLYKRIEINLISPTLDSRLYPALDESECRNILKQFEGKRICNDDVAKAIDTLIAYYAQEGIHKTIIDIDKRDKALATVKEMTLDEVEKELGYKIKIVNREEEE
ncbi:MAG: hypothetical protein ACI4WG_05330 [Erysipelotrichaceae bacterium]